MNCPRCGEPLRREITGTHLMRADGRNVWCSQPILVCNCGYARFDFPTAKGDGDEQA